MDVEPKERGDLYLHTGLVAGRPTGAVLIAAMLLLARSGLGVAVRDTWM